jgi:L-ascorbate metabolism protein UlaG (beta-lactamase superfamily)
MIIKMDEQTIFTDPFFSRAAVVISKKVKIKFDYSKVPQRPVVLISHNHYDHLDKTTIKKLVKKEPVFIVPLGVKSLITKFGAKEVHELDWWENVTIDSITYTLVPAQHWSRRLGKGQESGETLWGGYVIEGSKTIYFSGDTGYFIGFKEFGEKWDVDYAIMGAGAYEPRWFMHYAHMNVQEFFIAAEDLKAKYAIPMHFGVISLSDEPLLYPLFEIENAINQRPELSERILPLRVGEFVELQ